MIHFFVCIWMEEWYAVTCEVCAFIMLWQHCVICVAVLELFSHPSIYIPIITEPTLAWHWPHAFHYNDVILSAMAYQMTDLAIVNPLFIQAQIKENIHDPRHCRFVGNSPVTGEFYAQRTSNAENVSIWWRHHALYGCMWNRMMCDK